MKKGQIEIIGLAVIVIFLIVAGLFFVKLYILKPGAQSKEVESTMANSLLSAILKTTICEDKNVFDGIKTCYEKSIICNKNSCSFTKDEIQKILNLTLVKPWDYKFEIKANNKIMEDFSLGNCKTGIAAAPYSLPSRGVNYDISFKICKK